MKAFAFMMLFAFSVSTVQAQMSDRSNFFDRCQEDAPVGPSEADVANMFINQCEDSQIDVVKTTIMSGNDCDWNVDYTYDITCGDFQEQIKIVYIGGDRTPPSLNDGAQVPTGEAGMNLCLSQAPSGPKMNAIAGLYSDNCGEVIVTKTGSVVGTDCSWTAYYKYMIKDTCNNMITELDINYSGGDTQAPQLNKGAVIPTGTRGNNLCYDNKPLGPTEEEIEALYTDNCGTVTVTKTIATEKGNDDCKWLSAFQYTVKDDCNNFADTFYIEYMGGDSEDPVLSGVPGDTEVSCIDSIPTAANVTATDNCTDNIQAVLTENSENLGSACEGGVLIRTWTAIDFCGNIASESQTIVVLPAPIAEFEPVSPEIISCEEAFSFEADDLRYSNNISKSDCSIQGSEPGTVTPNFTACGGTITVNWTYTDDCLRTINAEKVYTVTPAPAATLDPVSNFSLSCEEAAAYVAAPLGYNNGLEGDCSLSGSINPLQKPQFDACGGKIVVLYNGEDNCGNPLSATLDITVLPAPAGVFDAIDVEEELSCADAEGYVAAALNYSNGLEGDCNISGSVEAEQDDNFDKCGGTITITWTGQDECENPLSATTTINVLPAPEATVTTPLLPESIDCADVAGYVAANATYTNGLDGACNISGELEATILPDYDSCGGKLVIAWRGIDDCQRPLSAGPLEILVNPAPAPEVTTPELPDSISCAMAADYQAPNATYTNGLDGLCLISGELEASIERNYDSCGGKLIITYTGSDVCGNPLTGTDEIVVDPAPAPEVTTPELPDSISCAMAADYQAPNATYTNGLDGLCLISGELEASIERNYDSCGGKLIITYTGSDVCGNPLTGSDEIVVDPAPAPVFDPIEPDTIACEDVASYIPELLGYSNGIDGTCGISGDIRGVAEAFDGSCGTFEVNFSYESCGELISASQTITVIDQTAPMLVGELPQGMSDVDACLAGAPAPPTEEYIEGLFTDNCGNVNATLEIISPEENTDCLWAVLYRYTIVDDCNNYAAPVKIYHNGGDKTAPELVGNLPEGVTGLQCMDENPGAPDLQAIKDAYTDNCGDVVITPFEPYMTGDNCGWTATYEYEIKDTCGNKLPNLVITNSGADTIAPELDGEIPVGMNTVNACKDSDLGEPTEEEIAALFSDNCAEITAENVTKIEKLSIGSNCEWIRVFEYIVTDGCNAYPTFKVNYQGGDTGLPVKDPNCNEGPMVLTTEMGAVCPADAVIDLATGDYITPNGLFTVAGLDLSQMQAALPLCFSDNCTAVDDLKYIVVNVDKQMDDSCAAILTVEFAAEDLCENVSDDVMTCIFIVNDTTAPVLTCPAGEDFGLVDVTPSAFDLKATWTDNCQGSGETGEFTDVLTDTASDGSNQAGVIFTCDIDDISYEIPFGASTGTDANGYNTYDNAPITVNGAPDDNSFMYNLFFNASNNLWESFNVITNERVFFSAVATSSPSCDFTDWEVDIPSCSITNIECEIPASIDYTLVRTFTAEDNCGNIGECTVTYSWSISSQGSGSARNTQLEDKKIDFKVFPVPFDNEVTLTYEFDYRTDVTIEFYDTKGLLVLSETNNRYVAGSTGRTKLDLSRTSSQVFYVKLTTNQGTVTKKIVSSGK